MADSSSGSAMGQNVINFWDNLMADTPNLKLMCILTFIASVYSFITSTAACFVYVRGSPFLRMSTRNGVPALNLLAISFFIGIICSLNFLASTILQLAGAMRLFCDISAFGVQVFFIPQSIIKGFFFVSIALEQKGRYLSDRASRVIVVFCVIFGIAIGIVPATTLPVVPQSSVRMDPTMPWCWLPPSDLPNNQETSKLLVIRFLSAFFWPAVVALLGLVSFIFYCVKRSGSETKHYGFRLRLCCYVWMVIAYGTFFVRFLVAEEGSSSGLQALKVIQSLVIPLVAGLNATTFLVISRTSQNEPLLEDEGAAAYQNLLYAGRASPDEGSTPIGTVKYGAESRRRLAPSENEAAVPMGATRYVPPAPGAYETEGNFTSQAINRENSRVVDDDVAAFANAVAHTMQSSFYPTGGGRFRGQLTLAGLPDDGEWVITEIDEETGMQQMTVVPPSIISKIIAMPKPPMAFLMAMMSGYCDTAGFIAASVFPAHVTGNYVVIAADFTGKRDFGEVWVGITASLVFFFSIFICQAFSGFKEHKRACIIAQTILLLIAFIIDHITGPFYQKVVPVKLPTANGVDWNPFCKKEETVTSAAAVISVCFMCAAMGIQNLFQRSYLVGRPMTPFMSGNTTQTAMDCLDVIRKRNDKKALETILPRLKMTVGCIFSFFVGAVIATVLYTYAQKWVYFPGPFITAGTLLLFWKDLAPTPTPAAAPQAAASKAPAAPAAAAPAPAAAPPKA